MRGRSDVIILFLFNNYVVVKILIFIYLYFKLDEYFMKKRREMERESVGCTAGPSSMIRLRKRKTTVRRGRGGTAWAPAMMIWWRTEVGPTCLLVFPSVAHRDLIKIKRKIGVSIYNFNLTPQWATCGPPKPLPHSLRVFFSFLICYDVDGR